MSLVSDDTPLPYEGLPCEGPQADITAVEDMLNRACKDQTHFFTPNAPKLVPNLNRFFCLPQKPVLAVPTFAFYLTGM